MSKDSCKLFTAYDKAPSSSSIGFVVSSRALLCARGTPTEEHRRNAEIVTLEALKKILPSLLKSSNG